MNTPSTVQFERLSTGADGLDLILDGGIPRRSVNIVMGEPGAGKTLCVLQMLFHLAKQGKKSLYFTTLSEPAVKLLGYMQRFSFFDAAEVDRGIAFADLGTVLRERGSVEALARVIERVEAEEPDVVVIDTFKAMTEFIADPIQARGFVYELAVQMAGWGATTFLLGEYGDHDVTARPEFAIADGILRFGSSCDGLTAVRDFTVLKLRGASYRGGQHFFEIDSEGLSFHPRVHVPRQATMPDVPFDERSGTGVAGLDLLLGGGLPRASSTVVQGGTGTGKTILSLHFLLEGARRGEPGVLFTLEEDAAQIARTARNFGWDLAAAGVTIEYTSPVELSTDRFLHRARELVARRGAKRAVIDSLSSLELGAPSERRFKEVVYALAKHFRVAEVTLLMTMEVVELLGSGQLSGRGISFAADNLLQLRYVELDGRLERGVSVLKARGIRHGTEVRRVTIGDAGMVVGPVFEGMRGVLTGLPTPIGEGRV